MKNRRDENEPSILAVFNAAGWFWQSCDRMQGHDGNAYGRGNAFEVEIKMPGKKLTPREEDFARDLARVGRRLWVLWSDVEAEWLVNAEYERIPDRTEYLDIPPTVYQTRTDTKWVTREQWEKETR